MLAGVGGQGIIRASDMISMALMEAGFDVKKSEVHGMAQRGGSVTSFVRYGNIVHSPLAWEGSVDILLSFEKLETLRYLEYVKKGGRIIISNEEIFPPDVNLGNIDYPHAVLDIIKEQFRSVKLIDIAFLLSEVGNVRTANTVMLGVLSRYLTIEYNVWVKIIHKTFPDRLVQDNIKAFINGSKA
jgi:indolepyruvate ferredoxin oxidoreductase beta subunit